MDPEVVDDLKQAQRVAEAVFEYTQPVLITDARARIQKVNPAFCELMGFTEEEMLGRTPRMFRSDHHNDAFYAQMLESIKTTGVWEGEI
ncbi:PAS domain S-box protein [Orrella sp. 11846]|uniref:PAS domain S-box protein n=1 Tax=Orrella sp. 11846 TaxID=3409913 RepID=UPI003B5C6026